MSDLINGKQSWTSGSNAIWYWQGHWQIGSLDNIGTSVSGMHTYDVYGGLDDNNNEWLYWNHETVIGWTYAGSNQVSIDCTSKNG